LVNNFTLILQARIEEDVFADTGDDKKDMCLKNGAEKWIDFKKTSNVVEDVQAACDGLGPHAAVVTSPIVRTSSIQLLFGIIVFI
jgi:hypothetical protein